MTFRDDFQEKVDAVIDHIRAHPVQYMVGSTVVMTGLTVTGFVLGHRHGFSAHTISADAAVRLAEKGYVAVRDGPLGHSGVVIRAINKVGVEWPSKSATRKALGLTHKQLELLLSGEISEINGMILREVGRAM